MQNELDYHINRAIQYIQRGLYALAQRSLSDAIYESLKLGWYQHTQFLKSWNTELSETKHG